MAMMPYYILDMWKECGGTERDFYLAFDAVLHLGFKKEDAESNLNPSYVFPDDATQAQVKQQISNSLLPPAKSNSVELASLKTLMESYLEHNPIVDQELQQLPDKDRTILQAFMNLKRKAVEESASTSSVSKLGQKRVEEKNKIAFRKFCKFSQKKFFASEPQKSRKGKPDHISYYTAYFGEIAQKKGYSLEAYFQPHKKIKGENGKVLKGSQNSFSATYIDLILDSEKFRDDCRECLEEFKKEYKESRSQKIDKLLVQIEKVISTASKKRNVTPSIEDLLKKTKIKLPWSDRELLEAERLATEKIDKLLK